MLNNKLTFGALILMAGILPQAQADSVLFPQSATFTLSTGGQYSTLNGVNDAVLTYTNGSVTMTLTGYICGASGTLCDSTPDPAKADTADALHESSSGVGLVDDPQSGVDEIPRNEFVQVDFSTMPANATITSVEFSMADVVDGWDIYTSRLAGKLDSTATTTGNSLTPAAQGNNVTGYTLAQFADIDTPALTKGATTGSSTITSSGAGFYNVTALQADCETLLTSITVNFDTPVSAAPEPASLILVGGVLIGIGTIRKRKKA
jgi:hypothetical protein